MTSAPDAPIERWSRLRSWLYTIIQGSPERSEAIVRLSGVGPGSRVLDIGCGPGSALRHALDAGVDSAHGVDPSPSMVKRATAGVPGASIAEGSAEDLPFDDATFTTVWSVSAFHHWADPDRGIVEVMRVLEPSGVFYLVERQLKRGKTGHGISEDEAVATSTRLKERFALETSVDVMRAGSAKYLVIKGAASA